MKLFEDDAVSCSKATLHANGKTLVQKPPKVHLFDQKKELTIQVNKDYAKKYKDRKEKEQLTKLKTKYKHEENDSEQSDEEEEEDEEGQLLTPAVDKQILRTISLIKSRDPRVYKKDTHFFTELEVQPRDKPVKPFTLKDYERKLLLENGGIVEEEKNVPKTFQQEQERLRFEFLAVAENVSTEEFGFLEKKEKDETILAIEQAEYEKFLLQEEKKEKQRGGDVLASLRRYWSDPHLNEEERFLRDYVLQRGWIESPSVHPSDPSIPHNGELESDAEELIQQEEFERVYNFRFEEPDAAHLVTHSRSLEDSVRRVDSRRKESRMRKDERKKEKERELIRLKALRKKEILEKVKLIEKVSGVKMNVKVLELDKDWDENRFDQIMQKMFDEAYYQNSVDTQKPMLSEEEDDQLDQTSSSLPVQIIEPRMEEQGERDSFSSTDNFSSKESVSRAADSAFLRIQRESLQRELRLFRESNSLGFRYASVKPETFGLTPLEVLLADEKHLNDLSSLKHCAPYRHSGKLHWRKRKEFRENLKKKLMDEHFWENVAQWGQTKEGKMIHVDTSRGRGKRRRQRKKKEGTSAQEQGSSGEPMGNGTSCAVEKQEIERYVQEVMKYIQEYGKTLDQSTSSPQSALGVPTSEKAM